MINPYAPVDLDSATQDSVKLYSPGHIAWASFLGAPIAGCVLMAMNYRSFGDSSAAKLALAIGFIATSLLLAISFILPEDFPSLVLPVAYTFGMFHCTKSLQSNAYQHRLATGGIKASAWAATGVGILCAIVTTAVLFAVLLVAPAEWVGEEL